MGGGSSTARTPLTVAASLVARMFVSVAEAGRRGGGGGWCGYGLDSGGRGGGGLGGGGRGGGGRVLACAYLFPRFIHNAVPCDERLCAHHLI